MIPKMTSKFKDNFGSPNNVDPQMTFNELITIKHFDLKYNQQIFKTTKNKHNEQ